MATFISYSRVNSDFAVRLAKDLRSTGYEIWLDQLDIPTGSRWDDEIEKALENSPIFLIILSTQSIQSQNVKDEIGYAIDAGKHILPVVIEDCKVPFRLRRFQYVDFTKKPYRDSLAEIKDLLTNTKKMEDVAGNEEDNVQPEVVVPQLQVESAISEKNPIQSESPTGNNLHRKSILTMIGIATVLCVVVAGFLGLRSFYFGKNTPTPKVAFTDTNTSVVVAATETATEVVASIDAEMIIIPKGKFTMGNGNDDENEQPVHVVDLSAFYIDKYEVTNFSYKTCVASGSCESPVNSSSNTHSDYYDNPLYDNYPVIYVDWNMAKTFCEWRGARLPTEAEWEKSARGTDGRIYPWAGDISCASANYKECGKDAVSVGSYENGISPYGAYDMAGNVWEWVADLYQRDYYAMIGDGYLDPMGPTIGNTRVLRGGSWYNSAKSIRVTIRNESEPSKTYNYVGFRCAHNAAP